MSASQITDEKARAAIRAWIDQLYSELDRSTYYHLLQVPDTAHEAQIRTAYYTLVARLHPDLYAETLDRPTREKLVSVYSRLVEAYRCISDGARRELYDRGLREGRLRFSPEEEKLSGVKRDPITELKNENAKRFFKLAMEAMRTGNAKSAVMNLKFALQSEPTSSVIKAELARAEELVKKQGA